MCECFLCVPQSVFCFWVWIQFRQPKQDRKVIWVVCGRLISLSGNPSWSSPSKGATVKPTRTHEQLIQLLEISKNNKKQTKQNIDILKIVITEIEQIYFCWIFHKLKIVQECLPAAKSTGWGFNLYILLKSCRRGAALAATASRVARAAN